MTPRTLGLAALLAWLFVEPVAAHGVAQDDAAFFMTNVGTAVGPFMYLGAKHMFTGYDHLLFLVGVLFFLYRLRDVVLYVSLFTLGHSVTLLAGVIGGIRANPFLVFTSNVFAILGLRSMYFLLAGVIERFHYLKLGLSVVLTFVGVKMLITFFHIEVPIGASLGIVAGVLATSVVASLVFPQAEGASAPADGSSEG